jgi:hypothetical protein
MNREWIPETIGASYAPRRSALLSVITITVHLIDRLTEHGRHLAWLCPTGVTATGTTIHGLADKNLLIDLTNHSPANFT